MSDINSIALWHPTKLVMTEQSFMQLTDRSYPKWLFSEV